jgi:hypothetical protein
MEIGRSVTSVVSGGICIIIGISPAGPYVSATARVPKPAYRPTIHAPNKYDVPSVARSSVTSHRSRRSLFRRS